MSMQISAKILQYFFRPLAGQDSVSFKTLFRNSRKILIIWPDTAALPATEDHFRKIRDLFTRRSVAVLMHEACEGGSVFKILSCVQLDISPKAGLRKIMKSGRIRSLCRQKYDCLIDLNPRINLAAFYLCRRLDAPLRIGFAKPGSNAFYNLVYAAHAGDVFETQVDGLWKFLKKFQE
ncbi:hypothetical protein JW906_03745 [bacterium]|nr:hypothetical protein [bacterium]